MVERGRREPDIAAPSEHLPEHRRRGPADQGEVVLLRQHDVDLHAPHRRHVKGLADGIVGQKVGRHHPDRPLGRGQGGRQHEFDPADVGIVGSEADAAGKRRPYGSLVESPGRTGQCFFRRECPVFGKDLQEVGDDRALEAEVEIADGVPGLMGQPAAVADIQAAGESDLSVHHQELTVVAEVGVREKDRHGRRQKPLGANPPGREQAGDRRKGVGAADPVDQNPHLHPAGHGPPEGVGKLPPGGIVVEDIGGHPDAAFGLLDGGQHRRVGLVASLERFDRVAVEQRAGGHPAHECGEGPQGSMVGADGLPEPVCIGHSSACLQGRAGDPRPELGGPGANPVHSQQEIGHGTEDRRQPDQSHPPDRGAGVTLDEDRVG